MCAVLRSSLRGTDNELWEWLVASGLCQSGEQVLEVHIHMTLDDFVTAEVVKLADAKMLDIPPFNGFDMQWEEVKDEPDDTSK